jgi:hypothetical protein
LFNLGMNHGFSQGCGPSNPRDLRMIAERHEGRTSRGELNKEREHPRFESAPLRAHRLVGKMEVLSCPRRIPDSAGPACLPS